MGAAQSYSPQNAVSHKSLTPESRENFFVTCDASKCCVLLESFCVVVRIVLWERNVVDVARPHLVLCDEGVSCCELFSQDNIWQNAWYAN